MQMTSIRPPAYEYVSQHGDLLTQLGASKVEATDAFTIKATYHNNRNGVNAEALLNDTVWGAQLLVSNESLTADFHVPTVDGLVDLLKGVAGLEVSVATARCPGGPTYIQAQTRDQNLATLLTDLVKESPMENVHVNVTARPPVSIDV
jgi:hypothetical protein